MWQICQLKDMLLKLQHDIEYIYIFPGFLCLQNNVSKHFETEIQLILRQGILNVPKFKNMSKSFIDYVCSVMSWIEREMKI